METHGFYSMSANGQKRTSTNSGTKRLRVAPSDRLKCSASPQVTFEYSDTFNHSSARTKHFEKTLNMNSQVADALLLRVPAFFPKLHT